MNNHLDLDDCRFSSIDRLPSCYIKSLVLWVITTDHIIVWSSNHLLKIQNHENAILDVIKKTTNIFFSFSDILKIYKSKLT